MTSTTNSSDLAARLPLKVPADGQPRATWMVPIHTAAVLSGLAPHTLRWYERVGLVPDVRRGSGGRRQYSHRNLRWIRTVRALRATGMPVAMLKELTAQHWSGEIDRPVRLVHLHRARLLAVMTQVNQSLHILDQVESQLRAGGVPAVDRKAP